jgi:NAD(P)-dependent dehydrogenase (short-subunit alcohol dehydrogenase family)
VKAEDLYRVAGKVVAVTGGASGLGFAMARAMSDNGARVIILDADRAGAERAGAELSGRGGNVRREIVDLTDSAVLRAQFDRIAQQDGGLDVVFANAGITAGPGFLTPFGARDPDGAIENIPNELWEHVLAVNLHGVFKTIQSAVPHLKNRGRGRIIVTTSTAAAKTSPAVGTPYLAAKAAIAHLVRQLALELARFNITVNAIQPGPFQTRITTPELLPLFEQSSPSHRVGRLEEIEGLALFFASDASSFVTGAAYNIDGGQLLGRAD